MPSPNDDRSIRILHLSDIHFKADKTWDADPVLRALARFIKAEAEAGQVPDLVAITGDVAFAGVAEEYQLARDWLDKQLWPALPQAFPRDRLLLVPGNHDVDRGKVDTVAKAVQKDLLVSVDQNQIAKVLGDAGQRDVLLKRHAAYLAFLGDWLGETQSLPWWQRPIEIRGTRLHFAGLDSAWMACGNEDRGRLLLGRHQLHQTILHPSADDADWRLALLHHPWDYCAEFDSHEARSTIHQHCDLLLRGHLHFPQTERVVPPDPSRACLELAAGCVYENSRYPNAFQWIELHPRPRRVKVLYRAWIQGAWAIDRNQPDCPDGEAKFDLPLTRLDEAKACDPSTASQHNDRPNDDQKNLPNDDQKNLKPPGSSNSHSRIHTWNTTKFVKPILYSLLLLITLLITAILLVPNKKIDNNKIYFKQFHPISENKGFPYDIIQMIATSGPLDDLPVAQNDLKTYRNTGITDNPGHLYYLSSIIKGSAYKNSITISINNSVIDAMILVYIIKDENNQIINKKGIGKKICFNFEKNIRDNYYILVVLYPLNVEEADIAKRFGDKLIDFIEISQNYGEECHE